MTDLDVFVWMYWVFLSSGTLLGMMVQILLGAVILRLLSGILMTTQRAHSDTP